MTARHPFHARAIITHTISRLLPPPPILPLLKTHRRGRRQLVDDLGEERILELAALEQHAHDAQRRQCRAGGSRGGVAAAAAAVGELEFQRVPHPLSVVVPVGNGNGARVIGRLLNGLAERSALIGRANRATESAADDFGCELCMV